MMASSMPSEPTRSVRAATTPFIDSMATSVVEPPMHTSSEPRGSSMGTPAPSAAATQERTMALLRAPAVRTASSRAACSTRVQPWDIDTTSRFFSSARRLPSAFSASRCKSAVVSSMLPTAPSLMGLSSATSLGVRPSIWRASRPTARIWSMSSRRVST